MDEIKLLLGKFFAEKTKLSSPKASINEVEFRVYSQFGEDGIIQFIIHHLNSAIKNKVFVEIGTQNYTEANTRFLLENGYWQGAIIDACASDIKQIQESGFYWRNNLFAKQAFITKDNINQILSELDLPKGIGLLSLDIDGNDYWVLENLEVLNPAIIIVEYNSFFGPEAPISIPYKEDFTWRKSHPVSYFGASLRAFCHLLENRGYALLGSTLAGNNAFFVHKDINQGKLATVDCALGYRQAIFNSMPCKTVHKFSEQLLCLQYQQVVNIVDHTRWRLDGKAITMNSMSQKFNHINDFLEYNEEEFVKNVYRYLLCREPDEDGFKAYLMQLRQGRKKEEILHEIRFSPEGDGVGVLITGLTA